MQIVGRTINAHFVERPNRFLARVLVGAVGFSTFLPNPGRLHELLFKGVKVLLRESPAVHRKTRYDLIAVYSGNEVISVDSRVPNLLLRELLHSRLIPEFTRYTRIKPEFKFGDSRFDFCLSNRREKCLLEAKSCTLLLDGIALFPDAPTERGRRHVQELVKAKENGYRACILFLIQRRGAKLFRPNADTDPEFAHVLVNADNLGVEVIAYSTRFDGRTFELGRKVRVELS